MEPWAIFLLEDALLRLQTRKELIELTGELKSTVVYVTHDQVEAMTMGDRIAVMNNGKVEQIGTPIEIYNHPKTKFVAGFVGSPPMNFLNGNFETENSRMYFKLDKINSKIKINEKPLKNNIHNLAFRPQHIYITEDNNFDLKLKVFGIENLGKEIIVICEYGEDKIRIITEKFIKNIGDSIKLKIDKEKILFF